MKNQNLFDDIGDALESNLAYVGYTGGRWVKLGDGSYSGVITDPISPQASVVHWHLLTDDGSGTVQEKGTAVLDAKFDYLYDDNTVFDGIDIWIAFPPQQSKTSGSYYVCEVDRTSAAQQFGLTPLGKQALDSAGQPSVKQVTTLRATLNSDLTVTVGDPAEKYCYPAAITLSETVFTVDTINLSSLIADLSGDDKHQLCMVCLDKATNTLATLLTTAEDHSAPLPAREELTDDDVATFDLLNHSSYEPVIIAYLYDGQTEFVDDDEIDLEVRTFFPPAKAYLALKDKWDGTAAPSVTDDADSGYSLASRWYDTTNDKEYVCLDATSGAAVWKETTTPASGPGSGDVSGPGASTDRAIATWNGTGGATLRDNPAATVDSSGNIVASAHKASGTAGAGYIEVLTQSSAPAAPASGLRLYADATGRLSWKQQSDGYIRTIGGVLTGDRVWILPDTSDTFVGAATNQTLTNKTLTAPTIADFTNATHNHQNAAGGGTLDAAAIASGNIAVARIATALTTPGPIGSVTPGTGAFTTVAIGSSLTANSKLSVTISPTNGAVNNFATDMNFAFSSNSDTTASQRPMSIGATIAGTGGSSTGGLVTFVTDVANNQTAGSWNNITGWSAAIRNQNAGTLATAFGVRNIFIVSGSGNITTARDFGARAPTVSSTGAIVTHYGFHAENLGQALTTNSYAFYADDQSGSTTGNYAIFTNAGAVSVLGSLTKASASGATWNGIELRAATATITGSTNITTATGFNYHSIAAPTLTSANALTVSFSATLYIAGPPVAAGSVTLSNPYPLWVDSGVSRFDGNLDLSNAAVNFVLDSTTGSKMGTSTSQKFAMWGATPVVQPASANQAAVATTASTQTTPWGFSTQAQADGIITLLNELRSALVTIGAIKGAA